MLPDVDEAVGDVASWITPRLGGVGPTTVAMLLRNTVEAAERAVAGVVSSATRAVMGGAAAPGLVTTRLTRRCHRGADP